MDRQKIDKILLGGSFWISLAEIVSSLAMLAVTLTGARVLSPRDFGLMATVLLVLQVLENFSQTGFESALVQREKDIEPYLDVAWTWHVLRGLFIMLVLCALAPAVSAFYEEPQLLPLMLVVSTSAFVAGTTNVSAVQFQRALNFRALFTIKLFEAGLRLFVFIPAVLYFRNVWALVVSQVGASVIRVAVSYVLHPYRPRLRWDPPRLRELIRFGRWITGMAVIGFLIGKGDDMFVSKYFGMTALGVYRLAYDIGNVPTINITHVIGRIAFPIYARLQGNQEELRRAFKNVMRASLLLSGMATVGILIGAQDLVVHVLGDKWRAAIPLIQIIVVSGFVRGVTALGGPLFQATGRPDLDFKMNFPRFLITVLGLWPAAAWLGLPGVCYVVLVAVAASFPIWMYGLNGIIGVGVAEVLRECVSPLLGVGILLLAYAGLRPEFGSGPVDAILALGVAILTWLAGIWLLGRLTPYDLFAELRRVRGVLKK